MCTDKDLADLCGQVKDYQRRTGEESLLIVVEDGDRISGLHRVGFDSAVGLLVDGRPPSVLWYQQLDSFHALETAPTVLH